MSQQIIKLPRVVVRTGKSRSAIYREAAAGTFPKPIKLSERSSGWLESEIEQWIDERIAASREGEV
ncbi:hypothetical protein A9Q79_10310 [Methylophaga sp. 42_25_T18]|nr:hypothetical protein A9Q79_10310 [Methylophaga sp. 42_25_T18]